MTTEVITPLRQRMIEDMNSRKLCALAQPRKKLRTRPPERVVRSRCRRPKTCTKQSTKHKAQNRTRAVQQTERLFR